MVESDYGSYIYVIDYMRQLIRSWNNNQLTLNVSLKTFLTNLVRTMLMAALVFLTIPMFTSLIISYFSPWNLSLRNLAARDPLSTCRYGLRSHAIPSFPCRRRAIAWCVATPPPSHTYDTKTWSRNRHLAERFQAKADEQYPHSCAALRFRYKYSNLQNISTYIIRFSRYVA